MPPQSYRELLEDYQEKNFTKIKARSTSNVDVGTGNFANFKRFLNTINQFNFSIYYQQKIQIIISNIQTKLLKLLFHTKHNFFTKFFSPSSVIEWNKLESNLRSAASLSVFKKNLLKFIRPSSKQCF